MTPESPRRRSRLPIILAVLATMGLITILAEAGAIFWLVLRYEPSALGRAGVSRPAATTPAPAAVADTADPVWPTIAPTSAAPATAPPATVAATAGPTAAPTLTPAAVTPLADLLVAEPMPAADPVLLAQSLNPEIEIPRVVSVAPTPLAIGARRTFYISDMDDGSTSPISATLRALGDHAQMWVADGAQVDTAALARSAAVFDEQIYPTTRELFGSEWTPGVDGDPRLVVLTAPIHGAGGYFSSSNQYSRLVHPYSNECEMVFVSTYSAWPGTDSYHSTLAHEFQHLIHWNVDANEETWVNEGASMLAEDINGYAPDYGAIDMYASLPDLQLNTWASDDPEMSAHYGASYLFMRYLLDRFGSTAIAEIVASPSNGIVGIDEVLRSRGTAFDQVFGEWVAANAIGDPSLGDGRYGYQTIDFIPDVERVVTDCGRPGRAWPNMAWTISSSSRGGRRAILKLSFTGAHVQWCRRSHQR